MMNFMMTSLVSMLRVSNILYPDTIKQGVIMIIKTSKNSIYSLVMIFVVLTFFIIPSTYRSITEILFAISVLSVIGFRVLTKNKNIINMNIKLNILVWLLILLGVLGCIVLLTEYPVINIVRNFLYLVIAICLLTESQNAPIERKRETWIFGIMFLSVFSQLIYTIYSGQPFQLISAGGENYTGVTLYLLFACSAARKEWLGILLVLSSVLVVESRGFLLMIAIFGVVHIFKAAIWKIMMILRMNRVYKIFLLMFIVIVLFSYMWIEFVAVDVTIDNENGINDVSNKMRFISNVYAVEMILENKELLLLGYDNELTSKLGIEGSDYYYHQFVDGVRLVQTHNGILNMIVKNGALFSIIYLLLLGKILDNYLCKDNLQYILPYLANCLIMHSLLGGSYLLFWIFSLELASQRTESNATILQVN